MAAGIRRASFSVLLQPGSHTFSAVTSDASGNPGRAEPRTVQVVAGAPVVRIESPAGNPMVLNRESGVPSGTEASVQLIARTLAPAGARAILSRNGTDIATAAVVAAASENVAAFPAVTFLHGDGTNSINRLRVVPLLR